MPGHFYPIQFSQSRLVQVRLVRIVLTLQFLFGLAAILFLCSENNKKHGRNYVIYTGMAGYLWVNSVLLLGYVVNRIPDGVLNLLMCLVFTAFGLASSGLQMEDVLRRNDWNEGGIRAFIAATLCLIASVIAFADGIVLYLYKDHFI